MGIRAGRPEDAPAIADCIAMAESEMVHHFTGTTDTDKTRDALVRYIISPVPNRYSLANCLVDEEDGKVTAAMVSFAADMQPKLDIPLLDDMNRRGYNLDKLFFEGVAGTYYLSSLGVDPAFRGRGLGTALLRAAEDRGRELGFERSSLLVSLGKPKAMALYKRLGYSVVEEVMIVDIAYARMARTL